MLKYSKSFKHLVVLVVIAFFLILITYNAYRFVGLLTLSKQEQPEEIQATLPVENVKIPSLQEISSWHLFGKVAPKKVLAPKTRLSLTLIGIIASTEGSQARAIIADASKIQQHYKVGDKIKQNVMIKSIKADHVIIMHNSREEILPLDTLKNKNSIIRKVTNE